MTDKFQQFIGGVRGPQLVKDGEIGDDLARPKGYEAVRRIRSYHFADVIFRTHRGAAFTFPWAHLRGWLCDETGRRLTFAWPEGTVELTGRHLDTLEEDVMRRIVAELRQVKPGEADAVAPGLPVIVGMDVTLTGLAAGA